MDWKSIVLKKRMKFFLNITLIPYYLFSIWAYPCDVEVNPEPSLLLSDLYSMHHNQLPRNGVPNIVYSTSEIPVVKDVMNDLLTFSSKYSYSMIVDAQREYEYDLYLRRLLKYEHFQNCISVSTNLDSDFEYVRLIPNNDILLPKLYDNLNYLSNMNSFGSLTFNKAKTFIESKGTVMKLQGFNL